MDSGNKNGEFKSFYENGNLKESMIFENGLVNGKRISYWVNGLKKENNFVSGAMRGKIFFIIQMVKLEEEFSLIIREIDPENGLSS